jgi:hypothetical protein
MEAGTLIPSAKQVKFRRTGSGEDPAVVAEPSDTAIMDSGRLGAEAQAEQNEKSPGRQT